MIRVQTFPCSLPKSVADALNHASGRHYTNTLVWQYRILRRKGVWLSQKAAEKLENFLGGQSLLHSHSRDAAQQGFAEACKVAKAQRKLGLDVRYPHRRKRYRTTTWKSTGIRLRGESLLLARARGLEPVRVPLPEPLRALSEGAFRQVELVWDQAGRQYTWHVTIENGTVPEPAPGTAAVGVDLGEIHPAALTDGQEAVVISCRRLRATYQYTAKRTSALRALQDRKVKGSRRWKRLQRRKNRFLAQQERRTRDLLHKVSRAVVSWAVERKAGTLAVGDVRDIADGKRLAAKSQQKIGLWPHGKLRAYLTYKSSAAGIAVEVVNEKDTSKTCPACGHQYKPKGRVYSCRNQQCRFVGHRDVVGSVNILSRHLHGKLCGVKPPPPYAATTYRHPALQGKRSPLDTGYMARPGLS